MGAGEPMAAAVGGERVGVKPLLTALAWSVGALSLAGLPRRGSLPPVTGTCLTSPLFAD